MFIYRRGGIFKGLKSGLKSLGFASLLLAGMTISCSDSSTNTPTIPTAQSAIHLSWFYDSDQGKEYFIRFKNKEGLFEDKPLANGMVIEHSGDGYEVFEKGTGITRVEGVFSGNDETIPMVDEKYLPFLSKIMVTFNAKFKNTPDVYFDASEEDPEYSRVKNELEVVCNGEWNYVSKEPEEGIVVELNQEENRNCSMEDEGFIKKVIIELRKEVDLERMHEEIVEARNRVKTDKGNGLLPSNLRTVYCGYYRWNPNPNSLDNEIYRLLNKGLSERAEVYYDKIIDLK